MAGGLQIKKYRLPKDCFVRQRGRGVQVVNHRTRRIVRVVRPPVLWGAGWGWNTTAGGFYLCGLSLRAGGGRLSPKKFYASPAGRRLREFDAAIRQQAQAARKRLGGAPLKAARGRR